MMMIEVYHNDSYKDPSTSSASQDSQIHKRKIVVPANAKIHHIIIHSDKISSYGHLITDPNQLIHRALPSMHLDVHQQKNSQYQATIIASGDKLNHLHIHNYLEEAHAKSDIRILNFGKGIQNISVETTAHHLTAHTQSNTIARGIMDDTAKGNFTGKIIVNANAEKTIAKLENKNILLSKLAEMNTRPLLEVYNGDIQCSHGATVGYLDNDALFYLRSRGIPEEEARMILIKAFMQPALEHLKAMPEWYTAIEASFHEK